MQRHGPGPLVGLAALLVAFLLFATFSLISRWLALAMIGIVAVYVPFRLVEWIISLYNDLRYRHIDDRPGFEVLPPKRPDQHQ